MGTTLFEFDNRFDKDTIVSMFDGDMEHAEMIFEQFVLHTPSQVSLAKEAYQAGIVEPFRQILHKLKPVFGFIGVPSLLENITTIEHKCKSINSFAEVDLAYKKFNEDYAIYFPIIENELERLKKFNAEN